MTRERWIKVSPQLQILCTAETDGCDGYARYVEIEEETSGDGCDGWLIVGIVGASCEKHRGERP